MEISGKVPLIVIARSPAQQMCGINSATKSRFIGTPPFGLAMTDQKQGFPEASVRKNGNL